MNTEKIGKTLLDLRTARGLTQKEVAEAIGVTAMALSQYENGIRVPRDEVKIHIARFYNQTVDTLFYV